MVEYKPVTRVITIVLRYKNGKWKKVVTPSQAVVHEGDTISFDVQGDQGDRVVEIRGFRKHRKTIEVDRLFASRGSALRTTEHRTRFRAMVGNETKGKYSYGVYLDGSLLSDPEIEVKGRP
jgi:hypothetical protein